MPLVRELITVHKHRKFADVVMLKFLGVAVQRTVKVCILNHLEQQTFRCGTPDGVVYGQGFLSGSECERLEFDSRQVIARETPLFFSVAV